MYHKISEDGDQLKRVMKRFSRDFQFTSFLWQNHRPLGDHYLEFSAASFKSCSSLGIAEKDIKKNPLKLKFQAGGQDPLKLQFQAGGQDRYV